MSLPLEGIRVLDFGQVIADPHGTRLLRTLGADVIRIESSAHPDLMRTDTMRRGNKNPFAEGGWGYQENNRDKLCISLDLKSPEALDIVHNLVKGADIVTVNATPKAFHRMGIDLEALKPYKEDIIVINASGFGDSGPYCNSGAYAPAMASLCGMSSLIGEEGHDPYGYCGLFCDYMGAAHLAVAAISALIYRNRTGKGQFIDLSQIEAGLTVIGAEFVDQSVNGVTPGPIGNHHYAKQMAPHNCYPCDKANTWCVIAVGSDEEWENFRNELKDECPWVMDKKYNTVEGRLANQAELDASIEAWTKQHDKRDIAFRLQEAGVSAAMVQNNMEITYDDMAATRHYFKKIDMGGDLEPKEFWVTGNLLNLSSIPETDTYKFGPGCGQDNEYVLKNYLHMTDEQIKEADEKGAFGKLPKLPGM